MPLEQNSHDDHIRFICDKKDTIVLIHKISRNTTLNIT